MIKSSEAYKQDDIEGIMPEGRINMSAQSEIFGVSTQNGGMFVKPEGRTADDGQHRDTGSYIWAYEH
jgi:hypothetical protein